MATATAQPEMIDRFRVRRVLDDGPFAVVYDCRDYDLDELVALKLFRPTAEAPNLAPEELRLRFLYEARTLADLDGAPMIRLKEFGNKPDSTPYMVLPLMDGTLAGRLGRDRVLPAETARHVLCGVLDGLTALHGRDIVHRGLTPEAVLLGADERAPEVRLAGLERLGRPDLPLPPPPALRRHAPYIAPGARDGNAGDDPVDDLYSVGALAWRMLTGEKPPLKPGKITAAPPPGVSVDLWDWMMDVTAWDGQDGKHDAARLSRSLREIEACP